MKKENPLKNVWDFMKKMGYYRDFENYEQWQEVKYGTGQEAKENHQQFLEGLDEKNRKDFDYLFED